MTVGRFILILAGALVAFGVCDRVLDKLRLSDKGALLCTALIFAGSFLPDIGIGSVSVNIGGALIPLALCAYLLIRCDSGYERMRAAVASLCTAALVLAIGKFFPDEPESMLFDVNYLYGIAAGVFSSLVGRSRRGAFIAGALGVMLADIAQGAAVLAHGISQRIHLGGAGAMDAVLLSAVGAVLIQELIGEFRERIMRGAAGEKKRTFHGGEIVRSHKK